MRISSATCPGGQRTGEGVGASVGTNNVVAVLEGAVVTAVAVVGALVLRENVGERVMGVKVGSGVKTVIGEEVGEELGEEVGGIGSSPFTCVGVCVGSAGGDGTGTDGACCKKKCQQMRPFKRTNCNRKSSAITLSSTHHGRGVGG